MAFIKLQNLKYGLDGLIVSGTAAIVESVYIKEPRPHCRHHQLEKLGKVLWFSKAENKGIFQSPTRGLIEYCHQTQTFSPVDPSDPRLPVNARQKAAVLHFGDAFFVLQFLKSSPFLSALHQALPARKDQEKGVAHLLHTLLHDVSTIDCETFVSQSMLSRLLAQTPPSILQADAFYFNKLGLPKTKVRFFKTFIQAMRQVDPDFGKQCYIDFPGLFNGPFQFNGPYPDKIRLVLFLDRKSNLPVWYSVVQDYPLDFEAVLMAIDEAWNEMNFSMEEVIFDYSTVLGEDLIALWHQPSAKPFVARCSIKQAEYGLETLYQELLPSLEEEPTFWLEEKPYFGLKFQKKAFGHPLWFYAYVDKEKWKKALESNASPQSSLLVLLSNQDKDLAEILRTFLGRQGKENRFLRAKNDFSDLPAKKWNETKVQGKILNDVLTLILFTMMRNTLIPTFNPTIVLEKLGHILCQAQEENLKMLPLSLSLQRLVTALDLPLPSTLLIEDWQKALFSSL